MRVFALGLLLLVGCSGPISQNNTETYKRAALDSSFGSGGVVQTAFSQTSSFPMSTLLLKDGHILSVGETQTPQTVGSHNGIFAAALYSASGQLEPGFAKAGTLESAVVYSQTSYATSAAELCGETCQFWIGGVAQVGGHATDFALQKYNLDGQFDPSFGEKGQLLLDFGGADVLKAMAVQPDGKILLAGYSQPDTPEASAVGIVARMDTYGGLDSSFANDGILRISLANTSVGINQIQLFENRIILAGTQTDNDPKSLAAGKRSGAMWAYTLAGQPDSGFANQTFQFEHGFYTSVKIAPTAEGGLIALSLGRPNGPGVSELHLYRFDALGQMIFWRNIGADTQILDGNLAVTPDGLIYVARSDFNKNVIIERYLADGQLDNSFARAAFSLNDFNYISDFKALSDGLLLTVASSSDNLHYTWNLAKLGYN